MPKITESDLTEAFKNYGQKHGGQKRDYFAPLYLIREFNHKFEDIAHQVAFGNNDYGIDAYYFNRAARNFYLYQFKWSDNHNLFKESLRRLNSAGIERIFGNPLQDNEQNQLLLQMKNALHENQAVIDRLYVEFVFNGDPEKADNSTSIESLVEELKNKHHLLEKFFNRKIELIVRFLGNQTRKLAGVTRKRQSFQFEVNLDHAVTAKTNSGEAMFVGFMPLYKLYEMYDSMGQDFIEKNIRAALDGNRSTNRVLKDAFCRIVMKRDDPPDVFPFRHNGITLAAEEVQVQKEGKYVMKEPRLLNGAQTVATLHKFIEDNKDNPEFKRGQDILREIRVLAKVVTEADKAFITSVTINNNRQNPVEPWHLRANDDIQLEFQDKFREELEKGIYYERQERAFENLTDEDLEEMQIAQGKKITIKTLAQTFLAAQGEVDKMSRMREVFENPKIYESVFKWSYLKCDVQEILLAYKVNYRLGRITREIVKRGANKYYFIGKARNLVWALLIQGILNHDDINWLKENYGTEITMGADYGECLYDLASRRVRLIIAEAIRKGRKQELIDDEKYSFLRTKATYDLCMAIARRKYRWEKKPFSKSIVV